MSNRPELTSLGVENHFQVSINNHTMTIIESDLVPVDSFTTDSLFVGIGQRYDVTVDASQATDNYWLNITFGGGNSCGHSNNPYPAAIVHYDGASSNHPTYAGVTPTDHQCLDLLNLTPVVSRTVPTTGFTASTENSLDVALSLTTGKWTINSSSLAVDWGVPVAQLVVNDKTDWLQSDNVWQVDEVDTWAYWLIQNDLTVALPHPIHLHVRQSSRSVLSSYRNTNENVYRVMTLSFLVAPLLQLPPARHCTTSPPQIYPASQATIRFDATSQCFQQVDGS